MTVELRFGDYRTALADVEGVHAVITDPPYTSRVEFGYRSGTMIKAGVQKAVRKATIPYPAITEEHALEFADWATSKASNWVVAFNDHIGWRWIADAIEARGWYVFSPVVWVARNSTPRFQGDGPNDACEYIVVARPRKKVKVGSLPGYYDDLRMSSLADESEGFVGQKPLSLMRKIVRDYTNPGELIAEPHTGTGSTLLAAAMEGRRAIGAEMDPDTYEKARKRLARGWTEPLRFEAKPMTQEAIDLGEVQVRR